MVRKIRVSSASMKSTPPVVSSIKLWMSVAIAKMRGSFSAASQDVHRLRNKNEGIYDFCSAPGIILS